VSPEALTVAQGFGEASEHILEIIIEDPGLKAFIFTFG
jgi:hypothetical protein